MPSGLADLKAKKPKKYLEGVHFDFEGCEVSYTTGAGAASLLNEPYLLKAKEGDSKELSEDEAQLLKKLSVKEVSSQEGSENLNKDKGDDMSKELEAELAAVRKENAVLKAKGTLSTYSFGQEIEEGVALALASLEEDQGESIMKAFNFLVECGEYGVAKAAQEKEDEVQTDLQKALSTEAGQEDGQEPVAMTKAEIIKQKREEAKGAK